MVGGPQPRAPIQVAAPSHQNVLGKTGTRRRGVSFLPAAVRERRGLHEAGAEDGGKAEDDEGADVHGALPRLLVDICRSVGMRSRGKQGLCGTER